MFYTHTMWRKRGRPKKMHADINKNTYTFHEKKVCDMEVLDRCLDKNIIDAFQHSSGIKLRWFYTIIFGAPTIQSKNMLLQFYKSKNYNEKFLQFIERKYYDVLKDLKEIYAQKIVLSICVFNEFPKFLRENQSNNDYNQKEKFTQGMTLLSKKFEEKDIML